jgi:hypothetical protein
MSEWFNGVFGEHAPVLAAMMTQARSKLRVDWTIPATWVIGMALTMVGEAIYVGVTASRIAQKFEDHENHQRERDEERAKRETHFKLQQDTNTENIAKHGERIAGLDQRIQTIEKYERADEAHIHRRLK